MKNIFTALILILVSNQSFAWTKILDCNNGQVVVDFEPWGYQSLYQLVIRDRNIVDYFVNSGVMSRYHVNQKGEYIVKLSQPVGSNDFTGLEFAYSVDGRAFYLNRQKNNGKDTLFVEIYRTSQATGGHFYHKERLADWYFDNCEGPQ